MLGTNLGDVRKQMQQTQAEMRHLSQSRGREMYWLDRAAQTQMKMEHPTQSRRREMYWLDQAAQTQKEISQSQRREMYWLELAAQTQMGMRAPSQSQRRNMCWLDWAAQTQMGMRPPRQSRRREMCWLDRAAQTQRHQMLHGTSQHLFAYSSETDSKHKSCLTHACTDLRRYDVHMHTTPAKAWAQSAAADTTCGTVGHSM